MFLFVWPQWLFMFVRLHILFVRPQCSCMLGLIFCLLGLNVLVC